MVDQAEREFFIGANTGRGFVCYAEDIFRGLKRLYLIKGGPGTGKSTLMKTVARAAKQKGITVETYRCSSDPDSLDGVVLRELSVGIMDATSPHAMEPKYPGARENLIDLGAFWDAAALAERFDDIQGKTDEKAATFATVYKYMGVATTLRGERNRLLTSCVEMAKLQKAVSRWLGELKRESGAIHSLPRQISSMGMKGTVVLPTYQTAAKAHWQVCDARGLRGVLLEELLRQATAMGIATWVSRDYAGEVDALYFPDDGLAVTCEGDAEEADRLLNTERFLCRECLADKRSRLRFLSRMETETMERVTDLFAEIRGQHFALEALYGEAMDYRRVEEATVSLVARLGL